MTDQPMNNDKPASESSHSHTEQPGDSKWKIEYSKYSTYCKIIDADGYVGTIKGREKAGLIAKAPEIAAELEQLRSERDKMREENEKMRGYLQAIVDDRDVHYGNSYSLVALVKEVKAYLAKSALSGGSKQ